MSVKVTSLVWEHAPVSGTSLTLLLAMADIADHDGTRIFKGEETYAEMCRVDVRTIRRLLAALADPKHPLIECTDYANGARGHFDGYRIILANLVRFSRQGSGVKTTGQNVRYDLSTPATTTGHLQHNHRTIDAEPPDNHVRCIESRPLDVLETSYARAAVAVDNHSGALAWKRIEKSLGAARFRSYCGPGSPSLVDGTLEVSFSSEFRAMRAQSIVDELAAAAGVPVIVRVAVTTRKRA